jgi:hypothetical protein
MILHSDVIVETHLMNPYEMEGSNLIFPHFSLTIIHYLQRIPLARFSGSSVGYK